MKRLLLIALFLTMPISGLAATYHAHKSGDNANSCATAQTSGATAKLTIGGPTGLLSCLSAGDIGEVHTGTYTEKISYSEETIPSGTSGSRITLQAATGETVTIQNPSGTSAVIDVCGSNFITFKGFIIDANNTANWNVVIGCGSQGVWIEDNEIKNAIFNGVLVANNLAGTDLTAVRRNNIHHNGLLSQGGCGCGYGIYSGTRGLTIEGNNIHHNGSYGIHIYSEEGNVVTTVIQKNIVHDNQQDELAAGIVVAVGSNIVTRNIVYNERSAAVQIGGFGGMAFVYNNTIDNSGTQGLGNSIFFDGASLGTTVIRNNAISRGGGISHSGANVSNNNTAVNVASCYVNAASGDFTLITGCALINAGVVSIGTLPPALNSTAVSVPSNGSLPAIGAHEELGAVTCEVGLVAANILDCTVQNNVNPPVLPASSITGFTNKRAGSSNVITANTRQGSNGFRATLTDNFTAGQACLFSYAQTGNFTDSALIGNSSNQELFAITDQSCTNNVSGGGGTPVVTQGQSGLFEWYGNQGSGTQIGATNQTLAQRVMVSGKVVARIGLKTTVADTTATNYTARYSKNGGAYAVIPSLTTGTEDLAVCDAPNLSAENTTQRITSGSFVAGRVVEVGAGVPTITMTNGQSTELVYPLCLGPSLVPGTDNIKVRVYKDDGTALAYDANATLNIDVVAPGMSTR